MRGGDEEGLKFNTKEEVSRSYKQDFFFFLIYWALVTINELEMEIPEFTDIIPEHFLPLNL
jgi:hypothetical protein